MKKSILFSLVLMLVAGVFFTACGVKTNPETKKAAEAVIAEMGKFVDDYSKIQIDPANPTMDQMIADKEKAMDPIVKKWVEDKFSKEIAKEEYDALLKQKKEIEDKWAKAKETMKKNIAAAKTAAPAPVEEPKKEEPKK